MSLMMKPRRRRHAEREPDHAAARLRRRRRGPMRTVFLEGLNSPFGMALVGDDLYIANTDAVVRYPYHIKQTQITAPGVKVVDLPAGPINHHWTKNIIASARWQQALCDNRFEQQCRRKRHGRRGGPSRHLGDRPSDRAASGVRFRAAESVGLAWNPETGALWTAVNERDEIGSDLVPDYMTAVQRGCVLRLALQLLRTTYRRAGKAAPPGSRGDRDRAGLRIGGPYRIAGAGLLGRQQPEHADPRRGLYRSTRVLELTAVQWLQGRAGAIRRRAPGWPTDGHTDGVSHCRWQCARSPGRRRHRQCGSPAGRRRCRQSRLACDRIIA